MRLLGPSLTVGFWYEKSIDSHQPACVTNWLLPGGTAMVLQYEPCLPAA